MHYCSWDDVGIFWSYSLYVLLLIMFDFLSSQMGSSPLSHKLVLRSSSARLPYKSTGIAAGFAMALTLVQLGSWGGKVGWPHIARVRSYKDTSLQTAQPYQTHKYNPMIRFLSKSPSPTRATTSLPLPTAALRSAVGGPSSSWVPTTWCAWPARPPGGSMPLWASWPWSPAS